MLPYFIDCYANPSSSSHGQGRRAAEAVRAGREAVADAISAAPGEIVFTGSATESNNLAILGTARAQATARRRIVVSAIEHKAVLQAARRLESEGWDIRIAPVLSDGTIDLGALVELVTTDTAVVSVQAASNEIGTIQPVAEVAQIVHRVGATFHCDASQALARIRIDVNDWDVDLLSLSAHKAYGPKGVGGLYVRGGVRRAPIEPLLYGGGQEESLRPGTLNVPGIVGFGRAAELATAIGPEESRRIEHLRDHLETEILNSMSGVRRNGALQKRLAGNSSLTIEGCDADAIIARLPEFALSTGSACSAGAIEPSHVLVAIGLSRLDGHRTIRVGLGRYTTPAEIQALGFRLAEVVKRIREVGVGSAA
jgi:cysteine desulfurase